MKMKLSSILGIGLIIAGFIILAYGFPLQTGSSKPIWDNQGIITEDVGAYCFGEVEKDFSFPDSETHNIWLSLDLPPEQLGDAYPPTFRLYQDGNMIAKTQTDKALLKVSTVQTEGTVNFKASLETFTPNQQCTFSLYADNWHEPSPPEQPPIEPPIEPPDLPDLPDLPSGRLGLGLILMVIGCLVVFVRR